MHNSSVQTQLHVLPLPSVLPKSCPFKVLPWIYGSIFGLISHICMWDHKNTWTFIMPLLTSSWILESCFICFKWCNWLSVKKYTFCKYLCFFVMFPNFPRAMVVSCIRIFIMLGECKWSLYDMCSCASIVNGALPTLFLHVDYPSL